MANKYATTFLLIVLVTVLTAVLYQQKENAEFAKEEFEASPSAAAVAVREDDSVATPSSENKIEFDKKFVEDLLKPRQLKYAPDGTALNHQLLHLHHMKTGGTSTEMLLRCGVKNEDNKVNFKTIHECGASHYQKCISGDDQKCTDSIDQASIVSYCAPMADLPVFGWKEDDDNKFDKITVLRHPVDRVWSMFRFQTKSCYECKTLKEVYAAIDAGDTASMRENCRNQLLNHMTRNMLSTKVDDANALNEESLREAKQNLQGFIIGLTSKLPETVDNIKKVFPFMDGCELEHANASPRNNRCGENNSHWDLPDHPDEETSQIIMDHNHLDLVLYEAAVAQFEVQSEVLQEMD